MCLRNIQRLYFFLPDLPVFWSFTVSLRFVSQNQSFSQCYCSSSVKVLFTNSKKTSEMHLPRQVKPGFQHFSLLELSIECFGLIKFSKFQFLPRMRREMQSSSVMDHFTNCRKHLFFHPVFVSQFLRRLAVKSPLPGLSREGIPIPNIKGTTQSKLNTFRSLFCFC